MPPIQHIAIYLSASCNIQQICALILQGNIFGFAEGLQSKKGALYSNITIREMVQEELLHDHYKVATNNKHSLATSSSGEQRMALLKHLIAGKPSYLIVDNVFDSLDAKHQKEIVASLEQIATNTLIIQLLYRKSDCLSFINHIYTLQKEQVVKQQTRQSFLQAVTLPGNFSGAVPPPIREYEPSDKPLVVMKNVSVAFDGRTILSNINWQINAGEFWQLVGANGSGKTTLLSMIIGDSVKGYGQELYLFGIKKGSGESVWDIKDKIGYFTSAISQEFPRQDTVLQMIVSGFLDSIGLYIQPSELQLHLATEWVALLGLSKLKNQPFRQLTMAQQRLVLIARAMVKHPPLLILDEPTAGLDDEHALLFIELVNKLATETNTAIVYVSHRMEVGMVKGRVFELGG